MFFSSLKSVAPNNFTEQTKDSTEGHNTHLENIYSIAWKRVNYLCKYIYYSFE